MIRAFTLILGLALWATPTAALAQTPPPQAPVPAPPARADGGAHQHGPGGMPAPNSDDVAPPPAAPLPDFIPPITDAMRAAAFPDVMGHSVHDDAVHAYVLADELEWQAGSAESGVRWETRGWIGTDRHRFWFRSEGDSADGRIVDAEAHALAGRQISRWWDVVAGVRQDARPGSPQTWAAVGVQGLAPYWVEVEATAYVSAGGRTQVRVEAEHKLLLTNRLVLQPRLEFEVYGKADPARRLGAGLSSGEFGLRLRYEVRREFAPYLGVTWQRTFFATADRARAAGQSTGGARLALGLRLWR